MSQAAETKTGSSLTDLTLQVRQEGSAEQEVFLQHGLTIGRNPSNTICIDHPEVERIHAQISRQPDGGMQLRCLEKHLHLDLPDGTKVQSLPLKPGTTFKLGTAVVRCLKRETKATVIVAQTPWQVRCPRCHEEIASLEHSAKKCPHCKLELQYHKSASESDGFEGWLPRAVGPYNIRAFVAQGGMGIVLRGLHGENDLPAAVKLLRMDSDEDPSWRQRFMGEINTLKTLKHPNVVRLQDHGQDNRMLWLAMDWIDGLPLSKWVGKAKASGQFVPLDQIHAVMAQVVSGLSYLHQRGIIHRDMKPSNILLAQDDSVKLVDFGIARSTGQSAQITQMTHTGMIAGTESYMSLEQADGQTLTPASDIYSLGIIWYELVTGRRPVGAYVPPNMTRPDCPATWAMSIGACLCANPKARPTPDGIVALLGSAAPSAMASSPLPPGAPPLPAGVSPVTSVGPMPPPMPTTMQPRTGGMPPMPQPVTTITPQRPAPPPVPSGPPTQMYPAGMTTQQTQGGYYAPPGAYGQKRPVPPTQKAIDIAAQTGSAIVSGSKAAGRVLMQGGRTLAGLFRKHPPTQWLKSIKGGGAGSKAYQQGYFHYERGDYAAAEPFFRQAANEGYVPAMFALGQMYRFRNGEEAYRWYKQGADRGDPACRQAAETYRQPGGWQ
jgi:serine/threonine protein kinase